MSEFNSPEDQAVRYVLGELTAGECSEFKVRLAESAELRALVRELEDGTVALAHTSPRRLPPRKVWNQIEKAVAGEAGRIILLPLFSGGWWRNGWAAAAAVVLGCLLYAFWPSHSDPTAPPSMAATENHATGETASLLPAPPRPAELGHPQPADEEATRHLLAARTREIGDLRAQIAALESNVNRLSLSVTQQQALLGEPNRLKFVQFKSLSSGDNPAPEVNLSPDLQHALALAMARELGWAQSGDASPGGESNSAGALSPITTIGNVDFVDLRPGTNGVSPALQSQPQPKPQPQPQPPQPDNQNAVASSPPAPTEAPHASIPAFISGQNLVMAIDSTIAPKDSQVTFSYQTPDLGLVSFGSVTVGNNPMVITVPSSLGNYANYAGAFTGNYFANSPGFAGWTLPISATIATAGSNTLQYFVPQDPPP